MKSAILAVVVMGVAGFAAPAFAEGTHSQPQQLPEYSASTGTQETLMGSPSQAVAMPGENAGEQATVGGSSGGPQAAVSPETGLASAGGTSKATSSQ